MAYVTGYEFDLFISYAWVNNQPEQEGVPDSGWIDRFKRRLLQRIDEKLGRIGATKGFFDKTHIGRNRDFNEVIERAMRGSAIVVALYSDGYLKSPACCEEMRLFSEVTGGSPARSGRLFLIRIDEVLDQPPEFERYLENLLGYMFYSHDETAGVVMRLADDSPGYVRELEVLRTKVAEQLKAMRKAADTVQGHPAPAITRHPMERSSKSDGVKPIVLLAHGTPDLRPFRETLIRYCESAGLRILPPPHTTWPKSPDKFQQAFRQFSSEATLFVQLLSECYDDPSEEFPQGIEVWQNEEAIQLKKPVLQWRDETLVTAEITNEGHKKLVSAAEVIAEPFGSFQKRVADRAMRVHDSNLATVLAQVDALALVKVHPNDEPHVTSFVTQLQDAHIRCRVTHNGRSVVDRLRETPYDALLVVLGECSSDWVEDRGDELLAVELNLKAQAPLRAYLCREPWRGLPPFVGPEILVIRSAEDFPRLLAAIRKRKGQE